MMNNHKHALYEAQPETVLVQADVVGVATPRLLLAHERKIINLNHPETDGPCSGRRRGSCNPCLLDRHAEFIACFVDQICKTLSAVV